MLGAGALGSVKLAHRHDQRGRKFAVKSIPLKNIRPSELLQFEKEVHLLRSFDHPNIVRLHEVYKDKSHIHLVTDYCAGGELFARINEAQHLEEKLVASLAQQLLFAVSHLHEKNICHRDIKPENFLFVDKFPNCEIKLIDFGFAWRYLEEGGADEAVKADFVTCSAIEMGLQVRASINSTGNNHLLATAPIGIAKREHALDIEEASPYFTAPEVLQGKVDAKSDIWSLGSILYMMLCGRAPFEGENNRQIFKRALRG